LAENRQHKPRAAVFYKKNMPISNRQSSRLPWPKIGTAICLCALALCHGSCNFKKSTSQSPDGIPKETSRDFSSDLALARVDLAKQAVAKLAPEQALPLLVAAIEANPSCSEAIITAGNLLQQTRWFLPEAALKHGHMKIDGVHLDSASNLWSAVSFVDESDLNSSVHTVAKWNLDTLRIENVLFPAKANETSCMLFDPTHRYVVIKRSLSSREDTVLLCDAQSLKPILDLGPLPKSLSPAAVIVFSPDGLLVAHPTFTSDPKRAMIWNLRDTRTGEIIRTSEPCPPDQPQPLTASLNRSRLRILHSDATLLEIPVSPANPETRKPIEHSAHLLQAQFSEDGTFAEALYELDGPHRRPILITLTIDKKTPLDPASSVASLERFPWSMEPNIWSGLLREEKFPSIRVDSTLVTFPHLHFPSYDVNSSITAVALRGDRIAFGDINGGLNLFKILPLPSARRSANPFSPNTLKSNDISAVANLAEALTGNRYDPVSREMIPSDPKQRLEAFAKCDVDALSRVFPSLDFSPLIETIKKSPPRSMPPDAAGVFTQRIARATDHSPHPELIAAFDKADTDAVKSTIQSAGPNGPAAAKALELALASTHPEWIETCLDNAKDLPPLLRKIAISRIAWLQDRKADAISGWPEVFPDLTQVRLLEDWDGWESADFSQTLEKLRLCVGEELNALVVSEASTPKQRQAVIARLNDPLTLKAVGRERFANACLKAALALAAFKEHSAAALKLAATARNLGESPAPCLRAEALSFTALGDYQKARDRWVTLITEHPIQDHVPGDYTEAAYTSFENADPQQAMAILTTGHHRFANDANFALRAGWIALLTNNSEQAYRFLLSGHQIGYPPEKLENSLALLALAAAQSGAADDAAVFYQDLIRLAPAWKNPKTIDTLKWPDEMKDSLRSLVP
jgi:hypothetical protein